MVEVLDVEACAREQIHLIEAVQGHGALLALDGPALLVVKASANAGALFATATAQVLQQPLAVHGPGLARAVIEALPRLGGEVLRLAEQRLPGGVQAHALLHRVGESLVLELEPVAACSTGTADPLLAVAGMSRGLATCDEPEACAIAAREVRQLTGYERVMIYRFAANGDGEVVAESLASGADSYFGLRFPASDIPPQARAAFDAVGVRSIVDTEAPDSPLLPPAARIAGMAIDLGRCGLRAVSPIHLEYLRNMRVRASLTAAIRVDGVLWGLIACHHSAPRRAPPRVREVAGLAASLLAARLTALDRQHLMEAQLRADAFQRELFARFSAEGPEWVGDLMRPEAILPVVRADGAALYVRGAATAVGEAGGASALRPLLERIAERLGGGDLLIVESIAEAFPGMGEPGPFAGFLAVRLSPAVGDLLVWTRSEVLRTVRWAGDPRHKVVRDPDTGRLSPRTSFAAWSEQVQGRCAPWTTEDLAVARALLANLRVAIGTVYGARQVLLESNRRFRDFSHMVAHDLQEPLRAISGFCDIIQRRYAAALPAQGQDYLRNAIDGAYRMQRMITDVLAFATIQSVDAPMVAVDLADAAQEAVSVLRGAVAEQDGEVRIGELPVVRGHRRFLVQLLQNLIGNAIKYRSERRPEIGVDARLVDGRWLVAVSDNGIGIAKEHHQRMFNVFTRVARETVVSGNGIGLALCKSIVELHGGEIWVDSEVGVGTTITCALPAC